MKKPLLFVAALGTALVAAVVFASPMSTETKGTPAKTPNRAEAFLVATCGDDNYGALAQSQSWHNALGSKRAIDRELILAKGTPESAKGCDPTGE